MQILIKIKSIIFYICIAIFFCNLTPNKLYSNNKNIQTNLSICFTPAFYFLKSDYYQKHELIKCPNFQGFYEYENIPPLIELNYKNYIGNFSSYFSIPIRKSFLAAEENNLNTNLIFNLLYIDTTFPFKAYINWENNHFLFKLGRDKLNIGPGYWSSMEINKQNPYWDYVNFCYSIGNLKLSEYIIRLNPFLLPDEQEKQANMEGVNITDPSGYKERSKNIVLHELNLKFRNILNLNVGELILIGGRSLQISDINPLLIFHNFYEENCGNVIGFFNLSWKLPFHSLFYIDVAIDDIITSTEKDAKYTNPSAFGAMLGYQKTIFFTKSIDALFVLETSYVSPTFGTRYVPLQTFYARRMYMDNSIENGIRIYVDYPVGYYLGNDLIDFRMLFSINIGKISNINLGYHILLKGEETLKSDPFSEGTGIHHGYLPRGTVKTTNEISLSYKTYFNKKYSINIKGCISLIKNDNHVSGKKSLSYGISLFFSYLLNTNCY
ncbi:MAG: hypothetical protein ACTSUG_06325 [Candidatus Helarchaeota archaeon]